MMKFFRKHTKELLAFFMCLLLIAWLSGEALTSILRKDPTGADHKVGRIFGKEVTQQEVWAATQEVEVLDSLGLSIYWKAPWAYTLRALGVTEPRVLQEYMSRVRAPKGDEDRSSQALTEMDWYLLRAEADHNRVYVPAQAVERFKADIGLNAQALEALRARRHRMSMESVDRAILGFLRVQEQVLRACNGIQISEADIQHFVRQSKQLARVDVVVLPAAKFMDESYTPTDEEMRVQFEAYRNTASQPAGGLDFGYQLPEAVQIEYIRIAVDPLVPAQTVSDERAMAYWREHKDEFRHPSTQPTQPADPRQPPPRPQMGDPYATFTEAKPEVVEKLRRDAAQREALRIAGILIEQLGRPWQNAPTTQPGDYKEPPASEKADDLYPSLLARWQERWPGVLSFQRTDLMDQRAWSRQPELSGVSAMSGTPQQITLAEAAFLVAGLEADPRKDRERARFHRNVYQTCEVPFVDEQGNAFVFRTVAARPRQAPASMELVREQLIKDLRLKRAHEQAGQAAEALKERAAQIGLEEAFKQDQALFQKLGEQALQKPKPFSRIRPLVYQGMPPFIMVNSIPGLGHDPELVEACHAMGNDTATQPAKVLAREQRRQRQWVVVQLLEILSPTQAEYDQERPTAINYYLRERQIQTLSNWFDSEQIRARVGWQETLPEKQSEKNKSNGETPADGDSA